MTNTGSVSLSYDGDVRASYLLLDEGVPTIRRVEYEVEPEVRSLLAGGIPHGKWIAKMLKDGKFHMP